MRIVGGNHRGRRLAAPDGRVARPTADRAREALFNILAHSDRVALDGALVVDAFAGSGALGLEALSRGAAQAAFLDTHPDSLAAIRANLDSLGEGDRGRVLRADATRPPPAPFAATLAFLDPPYRSGLVVPALEALRRGGWLAAAALVIVEVAADEDFAAPAGFVPFDRRTYGAARLVFLTVDGTGALGSCG
ncbi:MAG: 16S rRNA (guanine(966)-N(2))-methyltransferase RsmD [Magnetospirillum sp.]|nr:16S rRNA (guanine(966)-N(2))-methyltransferase RsmD [Magnetospirillum sp.]